MSKFYQLKLFSSWRFNWNATILSFLLNLLRGIIFNKKKYSTTRKVTSICLCSLEYLMQGTQLFDVHIYFLASLVKSTAWEVCIKVFRLYQKWFLGPLGKECRLWIANGDNNSKPLCWILTHLQFFLVFCFL